MLTMIGKISRWVDFFVYVEGELLAGKNTNISISVWYSKIQMPLSYFFLRFYLFFERKGDRKRGRKTPMCGCLSHAPYCEPDPQPRHVLWLGIKPATLWFPARTQSIEPHQPRLKIKMPLSYYNSLVLTYLPRLILYHFDHMFIRLTSIIFLSVSF